MAITAVADLDSIIQVIVMETVLTSRQGTVMPQVIRRINAPEHKGSPFDLPKINKLHAFAVQEGLDYQAPESVGDTDVSVNPVERIVQTFVTDRMLSRAPASFPTMLAEEHSRAWSELQETDILGLFSGFSNGLSSASNPMTVGNLGAARARVKGNVEPAPEPVFAVLHPYHAWDIQTRLLPLATSTTVASSEIGSLATGNVPSAAEQVLRRAALGGLFNMPVLEAGLISVDSSDDAYSAVLSKEALVQAVTDEGSMRPQRDESARGTELNWVGEYDVVERHNSYGYFMFLDAAEPTA